MIVAEIFKNLVYAALSLILIAMTVRSVLSWIMPEDNNFTVFLFNVTEPFVYPVRYIFYRLNLFQKVGIDVAYLFTFFIFFVIVQVLP